MTHRSASIAAVVVVAAAFWLAACSKSSSPGFHRVELTKDDIVSLFDVPLARARVDKFEWSLGRERYLRAVVEKSDDAGKTWSEFRSFPRDFAVTHASLIYKLDLNEPVGNPSPVRYVLRVRLGGRGGAFNSWSESSCMLELPQSNMQTESHFDDPDRVLTITSDTRAYRLRLEAQEKPFASH